MVATGGPVLQRRFLIASSLARLIRKERDITARVVEGYFPPRQDRDHFVSIEPGHAYLVLAAPRDGAGQEERTEVPRRQAEALFAVCAGKVGFERTALNLPGGQDAVLDHFIAPGRLDLVSVELEGRETLEGRGTMEAFAPPAWFGPEVTRNEAYERAALARGGIPSATDIALSNAGIADLLDTLEGRLGPVQVGRMPSPRPNATAVSDPFPDSSSEVVEAGGASGRAHGCDDGWPRRGFGNRTGDSATFKNQRGSAPSSRT